MAAGSVAPDVRPYFFGAKSIALEKKGGGIRPIASGEVLRRLAGKVLCSQYQSEFSALFLKFNQFGVAVPGGIEALVHASRNLMRTLEADHIGLKVDLRNAFNLVDRTALLDVVARRVPRCWVMLWRHTQRTRSCSLGLTN
jgi:hypothetical protein